MQHKHETWKHLGDKLIPVVVNHHPILAVVYLVSDCQSQICF